MANTEIKEIEVTVTNAQSALNAMDDGSSCPDEGQEDVKAAQAHKADADKANAEAAEAMASARSVSVQFPPQKFNSLKEGECDQFFQMEAYVDAIAARKAAEDAAAPPTVGFYLADDLWDRILDECGVSALRALSCTCSQLLALVRNGMKWEALEERLFHGCSCDPDAQLRALLGSPQEFRFDFDRTGDEEDEEEEAASGSGHGDAAVAAPAPPAVAAPAVAIKRQSVAAPVVAVKRQSIAAPTVARGGGVKKASPGSKKKVSPLKTVKPEPVSKASPSQPRPCG